MSHIEKLNVLFLPSRYPTVQLPINGLFVRNYARAVGIKHNVTILYLASSAGSYRDETEAGVRTIMHGIRFSGMGVGLIRYLRAGLSDFARIYHGGFKPDVIHVHLAYPAGLLAWAISHRYHIPMVLSEEAESVEVLKESLIKKILARRIINAMKIVCPLSRATLNLLEEYSKGPFVVVPPVIDTTIFHYTPPPAHKGSKKRILVVAPLAESHGIGYLLRGLGQLRQRRTDFEVNIVGEGTQQTEYDTLVKKLQLDGQVNFLGARTRDTVATLLQQCDFVVIPALYDIESPLAVAALATGKPIVSSRWNGAAELISDSVGLLVERASAEALCGGINTMLDRYHEYEPQAIVSYALSHYGPTGIANQFDTVYRRAITSARIEVKLWPNVSSSTWAVETGNYLAQSV